MPLGYHGHWPLHAGDRMMLYALCFVGGIAFAFVVLHAIERFFDDDRYL